MKLALKGIYKSFGGGNVLDGIDINFTEGEICALLGENGAGKSTLMNIVGGVISRDSGEILKDGKITVFRSPSDAIKAGIAFIHQELNLVNDLTVYENLFLSHFRKKGFFLDKKSMIARAREIFEYMGAEIDPLAYVGSLDASYKQSVAIARALIENASLIIMDEPTTSLSLPETQRLFEIMHTLKKKGITIIFISHKLREVMQVCDKYAVLRNGKLVGSGKISETDENRLASLMAGHEIGADLQHSNARQANTILEIEHLSDGKHFYDISLSVRSGEIMGVTGLMGDGRSELFETVFGVHGKNYSGKIIVDGREICPSSPDEAIKYGIAYLPKNRAENALIPDMSVTDNGTLVTLRAYQHCTVIDKKKQHADFEDEKKRLKILCGEDDSLITTLSGGNQQKTILAKWMLSRPRLLILDNPTQGVDILAKREIYAAIEQAADRGTAIIVLSAEAQEIIRLCSRCLVMFHGKALSFVSGENMTEENIMRLATGAAQKEDTSNER